MFAFTSMGGKIKNSANDGKGPYVFRLHGQNMLLMGGLLPLPDEKPRFSQLYIYDTDNELSNHMRISSSSGQDEPWDATIILQLSQMLDSLNPLVKVFRSVKDHPSASNSDNLRLKLIKKRHSDARVYNLPTTDEIAALIVGDFDIANGERDIIVQKRYGTLQRIDELHPLYLPMQYPLLFPFGEDGYRQDTLFRYASLNSRNKEKDLTLRQYFAYILQDRRSQFNIFLGSGKLSQQFIVDGYTMIESQRLFFIRLHQQDLRADSYVTLAQAMSRGETTSAGIGKRIILPSSFTGAERYCQLTRLFERMNCTAQDRPDLLSRIFKIKLNMLMRDITKDLFGSCRADIYKIEFQKRGLPHAHILIWFNTEDKLTSEALIDSIICAEIPDPDSNPALYEVVKAFMTCGPYGVDRRSSPCMVNSKCSKHFPKKFTDKTTFDEDGYCKYHRQDNGFFVENNGIRLDNRFVVPYNPTLLLRYQAHINVEFCSQSRSIKYLFKYVSKGHDKVTAAICNSTSPNKEDNIDEIKMYYDCRYISPCEAVWRIFGFDINFREPSVECLPFHLPGEQGVVFADHDSIDFVVFNATIKQTKFLAWFEANKRYPKARCLTYAQFPSQFVFKADAREWCERKSGRSIRRLYYVPPGLGELHYLRLLLTFNKGATSYEDIRTINGVVYPTFKDACYVMGLLDDDKEYIEDIIEDLFTYGKNTWMHLFDDILLKERHRLGNPELQLDDARVKDISLVEIENLLRLNGQSLANFSPMPISNQSLLRNLGGIFFVNGFGGSGKTYIWNTLTSALCSKGDIVLAVASSGIASQLIPGGRTALSRFGIPLDINENSTGHIMQGSDLAKLLVHTKLIIWDEAPMAH
ncbi:uncharacterized protein G2W53_018040 [Senna tora]|uniref:ATP-dependent DNA helicase n=1 Tax=Senna tora TaxID=362788 RepID=A0A834TUF6_9FABA|nr:uncharacterized protein G2W53_018040 [Senna tora]